MDPKNSLKTLTVAALLLALLLPSSVIAQDKPLFWTSGGDWGKWLKISNYPGLAVRTACGDDGTLNNYLVSSEDWQLQNNYREPMVVVWRVEFFNPNHRRNEMSGWMFEHLKASEVSNGWEVTAGHCKAWNTLKVQVQCAVPDTEENAGAACFKDSQGNPIAERTDQFRERPPQPAPATAQPATNLSQIGSSIWNCSGDIDDFYSGEYVIPGPWVIQFFPDRTITNTKTDDPEHRWSVQPNENWTQTGNQVSWSQAASSLNFSGIFEGRSMTLTVTGRDPRTHGTINCTRSSTSIPSVRYWYCKLGAYTVGVAQISAISDIFARPTSIAPGVVQKELEDWFKSYSQMQYVDRVDCSDFFSLEEAKVDHDKNTGSTLKPVGAPPDPTP